MKRKLIATSAALLLIFGAGGATAGKGGPRDFGERTYHYDFSGRLVAESGVDCSGRYYHFPLILGNYTETKTYSCN